MVDNIDISIIVPGFVSVSYIIKRPMNNLVMTNMEAKETILSGACFFLRWVARHWDIITPRISKNSNLLMRSP